MTISTTEKPLTKYEEERMASHSYFEIQYAIGEASIAFDDGELSDVVACNYEDIASLIADKNAEAIGNYIMALRRQRIADIASVKLYGKTGFIRASEVIV